MYGGQSTHIPIRIIQGGVIPLFLHLRFFFPATLAQFFQGSAFMKSIADALTPNSPLYLTIMQR